MTRPSSLDARSWHEYVSAAPSFTAAQDRMEEAVLAGVDMRAMAASITGIHEPPSARPTAFSSWMRPWSR